MLEPNSRTEHRAVYMAFKSLRATVLKNRPDADVRLLRKAYRFARNKHAGQRRKSGELYFTHPLAVAQITRRPRNGSRDGGSRLLHDVVEDTTVTPEETKERFGIEIAALVTA